VQSISLGPSPTQTASVYGVAQRSTIGYFIQQPASTWSRLRHLTYLAVSDASCTFALLTSAHCAHMNSVTIVYRAAGTDWIRLTFRRSRQAPRGTPLQPESLYLQPTIDFKSAAVSDIRKYISVQSLRCHRFCSWWQPDELKIFCREAPRLASITVDDLQEIRFVSRLEETFLSLPYLRTLRFVWLKAGYGSGRTAAWPAPAAVRHAVARMRLPPTLDRLDLFYQPATREGWATELKTRFTPAMDASAGPETGVPRILGLWSRCSHSTSPVFPCPCWDPESLDLFQQCRSTGVDVRVVWEDDEGPTA
jgi:hypothetical protein